MPISKANGINLYYEMHGEGHPLVLIAGFGCDTRFWDLIIQQLAAHFQVLIFDNRGIGQSDCPDEEYSLENMADDTIALMNELGIKKPFLLGHSMGGCIAQIIARRQTDLNKLILCNSLVKFDQHGTFVEKTLLNLRKDQLSPRRLVETAIPWFFSRDYFNDTDRVEAFIQWRIAQPNPQTTIGFARQLNALLAFDSKKWCNQIRVPTMIIHGEEDIVCPRDSMELAHQIPGAKLVVFSRMGHVPLIEEPDESAKAIIDFLLG